MKNKIPLAATCFIILLSMDLYAFEIGVHEKITTTAINSEPKFNESLNGIGITNGIDENVNGKKIREWVEYGSKQEDEPLLEFRYLNHFYNPLDGKGLHDGLFTGKSSYEWASSDQSNLWSWAMLRQYYYTGLVHQDPNQRKIFLSKAFRNLGQAMHLVQDIASPAHARNDAHPSGDGFEGYTNRDYIIGSLNYSAYSFANALTSVSQYAPKQFWDSGNYAANKTPSANNTQGLSEYTNANFASDDTIFTENNLNDWNPLNDSHYSPHPAKSETVLYDEFLAHNETIGYDVYRRYFFRNNIGGEEIKHFAYAGRLYKYYATGATDWEKTLGLDDQCYKDYAQKLIPRAVGYSAGLLDYFFRGKINIEKDPQNAGKYIIKNESTEKMEGTFTLYYDDASGNRNPVSGASWTHTINPNSKSTSVTFTEPTNPAPKEKGKYILVFNGKLGMEEGTAVGKEVKLEEAVDARVVSVSNYYWGRGSITVYTKKGTITGKLPSPGLSNVRAVRFDVDDWNTFVVLAAYYDYNVGAICRNGCWEFHKYSIDEATLSLNYHGVVLREVMNEWRGTEETIHKETRILPSEGDIGSVYGINLLQSSGKSTFYIDFFLKGGSIKPFGGIYESSSSYLTEWYSNCDMCRRVLGTLYSRLSQKLYYGGVVQETTPYNW